MVLLQERKEGNEHKRGEGKGNNIEKFKQEQHKYQMW
jgi:hypothetical protein